MFCRKSHLLGFTMRSAVSAANDFDDPQPLDGTPSTEFLEYHSEAGVEGPAALEFDGLVNAPPS